MTFILTAVCVNSVRPLVPSSGRILARPVVADTLSWARAGYRPGLAQHLGEHVEGLAFHLLVDEGDGYETSNAFVRYPSEEDQPTRMFVPDEFRTSFETCIASLLSNSSSGRIVLVFEDNGHVTSQDLETGEVEVVDVLGPMHELEFWRLLDLGQIVEDSVILLDR